MSRCLVDTAELSIPCYHLCCSPGEFPEHREAVRIEQLGSQGHPDCN